jgi:signal transduction histidine kinase
VSARRTRRRDWGPPSLGAKLVLLLGAVAVAGSVALALLLSSIITPSFARLERAAVAAQVERVEEAVAELRHADEPVRALRLSELLGQPVTLVAATGSDPTVIARGDTLVITVPIADAARVSAAAVRITLPRDLSILGQRVLFFAIAGAVALLLLVLLTLRSSIATLVLRPLAAVEQHMTLVGASGTPTPLDTDQRRDEIGSLVTGYNAMLRQLEELREQVGRQSFKLGQQENAAAVMHNVRNALNPISTILSHELATTTVADRALIDRAVAELASDDLSPERRAKLAAFVAAGLAAHTSEQQARAASFAVGRAALSQVLEIISCQRDAAHEAPPLASVDLTEVVAQNAAIARYADGASIAFVFPSLPHLVRANRVILSQVVGNLVTNAAEAIAARGGAGGTISVTITEQSATVELMIRDNGEGFEAAHAAALFERGFSSRAHKSGGLGLHWCANAVAAMGGTLRLESAGYGMGACAILRLPRADRNALAA